MSKRGKAGFEDLKHRAQHSAGFPAAAFSELTSLVSRLDTPSLPIGSYSPMPDVRIQSIRSIGFRKAGASPVPILHAKMFLLGHLWWHDEDDSPGVAYVTGFTPKRLWLASANPDLRGR